MKRSLPFFMLVCAFSMVVVARTACAQGILVYDASAGDVLPLEESRTSIRIEDQIVVVSSMQRFVNDGSDTLEVKYGFPLSASASATRVRWMLPDSIWHTAVMIAVPQDTTLPGSAGGGAIDAALQAFLGETPLYFNIPAFLTPGEALNVELTFVQLLPYANARVELLSTSDYSTLMTGTIPNMSVDVTVISQRELMGIDIAGLGAWSPSPTDTYLSADSAMLHVEDTNVVMNCGFSIGYDLDPAEYGLISLSNFLPDSMVKCDQMGNGFFALLIEPEPTSDVVQKDFVIVLDRSGSMSGTKIQEAKNAAEFMVNNLNVGDHFNVIAFSSTPQSWSAGLQPFTASNMSSALAWIGAITANGGTNINDALLDGIDNYAGATPGSARTLVFLTDGLDGNPAILSNVLNARLAVVPDLQLFTFGIGTGYNYSLLNQLADQNNGVAQFLDAAGFSTVMSDFYTAIGNPVLLSPVATFDQPDIEATYPDPLMGLFVGQQMIIVGRYDVPGPVNLHLDGVAAGSPVAMDFAFDLTGAFDADRLFLPKIWAQKAVDELMNEYYGYAVGSPQANMIEDSVVNFSMCYGIGSPFTSFTDPGSGGGSIGLEEIEENGADDPLVYPDPSVSSTPVVFDLGAFDNGSKVTIRIFDILGHLVLESDLSAFSGRSWSWDGLDMQGRAVTGQLFFQLSDGILARTGRLTRL